MTRRLGLSIAVVLTASVVAAAVSPAARSPEEPSAFVVASGVRATSAVLPAATWAVELAALLPGDGDVAVSPDGRRVAFVSTRDGNEELYVADASAGTVLRLTRSPAADRRPTWSPRGDALAWQSGQPDAGDLFVMRPDGTRRRLLVGGAGDDADPAWSPDGASVAFSSNRSGRRQLWSVAAAGGEPELLADLPGRARSPAWSPSGDRLAFAREAGGDSDVWLLDLADGTTRALSSGAGWDSRPDWSPRGGRIVALSSGAGWDSRPDWSPRGGRIVFARALVGRSSLWVVGADGAPATAVEGTEGLADPDWAFTDRSLVPRPDELLPDLDQRAPAGLVVVHAEGGFRLGFASSTENRGLGPLVIRGVRAGRTMRAHQLVELRGGATRVVPDAGRLHFEPHSPHHHWHLDDFVRYELRRADDFAVVARDRKTGFCLIDRWGKVSPRYPGAGPPRFVGDCAAGRPDARSVLQGTSVGYIDRYPAFFHGQELDLTGLPAGRYVLVHHANSARTMRELRYSDNAASVLLELRWPDGPHMAPRITLLRRCESSERCPAASGPTR